MSYIYDFAIYMWFCRGLKLFNFSLAYEIRPRVSLVKKLQKLSLRYGTLLYLKKIEQLYNQYHTEVLPSPMFARLGGTAYRHWRFLGALVLVLEESRKFEQFVKNKATGTLLGMFIHFPF